MPSLLIRLRFTCLALTWCLSVCAVQAAPATPMTFTTFWPCTGTASFCAHRILARGAIERDSSVVFAKFLASGAPRQGGTICFDSPGGSVEGAVELGRLIRRLQFNTCLEDDYREVIPEKITKTRMIAPRASCASACTLAFVGGVNRYVGETVRYGVHQFSGVDKDVGEAAAQYTVVRLAAYLEQMGVKRNLLDLASVVAPQQMYWLTPKELRDLRVDNIHKESLGWRLDATDDGMVLAVFTQLQEETRHRVNLILFRDKGAPILRVEMQMGPRYEQSILEARASLNDEWSREVSVKLDTNIEIVRQEVTWRIRGNTLYTTVTLPTTVVAQLRTAKTLDFAVSRSRAEEAYDPSVSAPIQGAQRIFGAALR